MPGYSARPLIEKLGLKPGMEVAILNAPAGFNELLGKLPEAMSPHRSLGRQYDFIQTFVSSRAKLVATFANLMAHLKSAGVLWICWPKRGSGVITDLNENIVREIGLAAGLVDVKVTAIDETWSGLKFVYRLKDRHSLQ